MVASDKHLYLFGGMSSGVFFGDLYVLDLSTWEWQCPGTVGLRPPHPRSGHAAALAGQKMLLFGGLGLVDGRPQSLSDVYILDIGTFEWQMLVMEGPSVGARTEHAMCMTWLAAGSESKDRPGEQGDENAQKGGQGDVSAGLGESRSLDRHVNGDDHGLVNARSTRGVSEIQDITDMFGHDGILLGNEDSIDGRAHRADRTGDGGEIDDAKTSEQNVTRKEDGSESHEAISDAGGRAAVTDNDVRRALISDELGVEGPIVPAVLVSGGVSLEGIVFGDLLAFVPL